MEYRKGAKGDYKPIIENGGARVHTSYNKIPLGCTVTVAEFYKAQVADTKRDHHAVVIVGASEKKIALNDPATFPFIECEIGQLLDARAYELTWPEPRPERALRDSDLGPLCLISVGPRKVEMPLLSVSDKQGDELFYRPGLLEYISDVLDDDTYGLTYRKTGVNPCCDIPLRLARVVPSDRGMRIQYVGKSDSYCFPDESIGNELKPLQPGYYWVHYLQQPVMLPMYASHGHFANPWPARSPHESNSRCTPEAWLQNAQRRREGRI